MMGFEWAELDARECFNISNDEEYLLEKGDLKNYFLSKEDDLDLHVNNLKENSLILMLSKSNCNYQN